MINVLGIPHDTNSSFLKGPSLAPPLIRQIAKDASANSFSENGEDVVEGKAYKDWGDIFFDKQNPAEDFEIIRAKVAELLADANKLFCFGGDHSITFPIIDAFTDKFSSLNILHFDAHPDLYDNFDNNFFSHASPFARIMEKGKVASLTQVGIRTLTPHQKMQAEKFGVSIIEMKNFSLDFINQLKSPLYLSLDLDVLDPAFAPGISHHEPGGLSTRELISIIHNINVPIVGADIVEYNPLRDINNMTAMVAYKLFKEILAKMLAN